MRIWMLIALAFVLAVGNVQAVIVNTTNDTFVSNENIASGLCGFTSPLLNTTNNFGNQSTVLISCSKSSGVNLDLSAFFKFPTSSINNKIIEDIRFSWTNSVASCGVREKKLFFNSNDTWDENIVTGQNKPVQSSVNITGNNMPHNAQSQNLLGSPSFMLDIYSDNFTTVETDETVYLSGSPSNCGITGNNHQQLSKEGSSPAILNATQSDFRTSSVGVTFGILDNTFCWDFDSQTGAFSSFTGADFCYNVDTNTLTPVSPARFFNTETSVTNTLQSATCSSLSAYSTTSLIDLNVPEGDRDIVCFDLSSQHGGKRFYGAIKIINATSSPKSLVFFDAMYSPSFTSFSQLSFSPDPPIAQQNLTVFWTTSQNLTSRLRFRVFNATSSTFGAFGGVQDILAFRSSHSLVIPAVNVRSPLMEFTAQGDDISSSQFSSSPVNKSVSGVVAELSALTSGINILVLNEVGTGLGGATVCLNGICQPTSAGTIIINDVVTAIQGVARFFFTEPVGTYNLTVTANGYQNVQRTIVVVGVPHNEVVTMALFETCRVYGEATTQSSANSQVSNLASVQALLSPANVTSTFCQFDPNNCVLYSGDGVTCIQRGGWDLYACFDGFHPSGVPVNSCLGAGQTGFPTGNQTVSVIPAISNPLASLFGITSELALAFLGMLIATGGAVAVGIKTREGLVTALVFLGLIMTFTLIGWIPLFVLIILGVITAFLIANFIKRSMTQQ